MISEAEHRVVILERSAALAGVSGAVWGIYGICCLTAVVPAFPRIVLGASALLGRGARRTLLAGRWSVRAYASEWSLLSMYLLLIIVVTFRARGLFGKKSILEA